MTRRRGRFATIPPPPQEGLSERELAFYTAVKQNLEMLTGVRSAETLAPQAGERSDRTTVINRYRRGTGLQTSPGGVSLSPFEEQRAELNAALTELNETVLPRLQEELERAREELATLDGKFPITSTDISNGAISTPQLVANAVTAEKILAGAVTTDKMTANEINGDRIKFNTLAGDKITTNTITADRLDVNDLTAFGDLIVAGYDISELNNDEGFVTGTDVNVTIRSATEPQLRPGGDALQVGDLWINTSNGDQPNSWNGNDWIQTYTRISGGAITTGTVQSANYVQGSTGWAIGVDSDAAEFGNVVARGNFLASGASGDRVEITAYNATYPATLDRDYRIWIGASDRNETNGRFWVDAAGNAKFGGRVFSSQLEGPIMDAVPIDLTGDLVSNTSNTSYVTVADRYIEIPALIDRPRRPFISVTVPVFGNPTNDIDGAWLIAEIMIQNDDETWTGAPWLPVVQEFTIDTTSNGSAGTISGGLDDVGNRGFRFRVRFKPTDNGKEARTNRFTGIFLGLPAGNGFTSVKETTGTEPPGESVTPLPPSIYEPPDFDTGWTIEP